MPLFPTATVSARDAHAAKLSLVGEPFPIEACNNDNLGLTSGFLICSLIRPGATTVNNLGLWLGTAGGTSTGFSGMALFSEAGVQLAITGDMTSALTSAGNNQTYVEAAVTAPYTTVDATDYYVAVLCQLTSNPTIAGSFSGSGLHIPTIKAHRPSIVLGSQTSMPASFNVGTATTAGAAYWLVAS